MSLISLGFSSHLEIFLSVGSPFMGHPSLLEYFLSIDSPFLGSHDHLEIFLSACSSFMRFPLPPIFFKYGFLYDSLVIYSNTVHNSIHGLSGKLL
jgi:hypothetical protein